MGEHDLEMSSHLHPQVTNHSNRKEERLRDRFNHFTHLVQLYVKRTSVFAEQLQCFQIISKFILYYIMYTYSFNPYYIQY